MISTVSIKRTVGNSSLMTLLNVQYDLHTGSCIDKGTVSIKRTVYNFSQMTLLNVLYDLKNETIIT